jgi:hypothetical protein
MQAALPEAPHPPSDTDGARNEAVKIDSTLGALRATAGRDPLRHDCGPVPLAPRSGVVGLWWDFSLK